jgi:hypothetical protein
LIGNARLMVLLELPSARDRRRRRARHHGGRVASLSGMAEHNAKHPYAALDSWKSHPHTLSGMFTEADVDAIRAVYEQRADLSAAGRAAPALRLPSSHTPPA